jgi:hypothetical protein
MFGPDYEVGACPGCSNLGDELDATRVHLNHRDVSLVCFSRAPIERLIAYKARMGWEFPYVSTYETEFPFDFGLAVRPEQAQAIPEVKQMIESPPGWLEDWGRQVGAKLEDGLRGLGLHRLRARERERLPHLHRDGARSVRRAVPLLPPRPHAQASARRAPRLAEGRIPGPHRGRTGRSRPTARAARRRPQTTRSSLLQRREAGATSSRFSSASSSRAAIAPRPGRRRPRPASGRSWGRAGR